MTAPVPVTAAHTDDHGGGPLLTTAVTTAVTRAMVPSVVTQHGVSTDADRRYLLVALGLLRGGGR